MPTSRLQRKTAQKLHFYFGHYTIRENSRPEWCLGHNFERLELDFYIAELDVAIEVQGQQHYVYTPHFHASYEDFKAQQERDIAKRLRCHDYRITLIEIGDELELESALDKIKHIEHQRKTPAKVLTPEQWNNRIVVTHKTAKRLFADSVNMNRQKVAQEAGKLRSKLSSWVGVYGTVIFESTDTAVVAELFWYVQKCTNVARSRKYKNQS